MLSAWRALLIVAAIAAPVGAWGEVPGDAMPREVSINGVELVLVPGGEFMMSKELVAGSDNRSGFAKVWVDSFYMAKYEARASDLASFFNGNGAKLSAGYGGDAVGCALRRDGKGRYFEVNPESRLPATHVSWELAEAWSRSLGLRLPTEAEWEKAARGPSPETREFPWGNRMPDETYANFATSSTCLVWPVDTVRKGVSPYGIFNMAGNVREHVADWLSPEMDQRLRDGAKNPNTVTLPTGVPNNAKSKIIKGGRWASDADELRISSRSRASTDDPFQCNGARFAADIAAVRAALADGRGIVVK